MLRPLVIALALLVIGLIVERFFAAEYIRFLEYDIRIEQAYRNLEVGMTEEEVRNLIGFPPDNSSKVGAEGTTVLRWAVREHRGVLHRLLGIEPRDEKSYMELFLDFDANGRLARIYYGG